GRHRILQEGGQEGLRTRHRRLPRLGAEEVSRQVRRRLAEGSARAHQRHQLNAPPWNGFSAEPTTSPPCFWRRCSAASSSRSCCATSSTIRSAGRKNSASC